MISSLLKDDGTSLVDESTFINLYPDHSELCHVLPALPSSGSIPLPSYHPQASQLPPPAKSTKPLVLPLGNK